MSGQRVLAASGQIPMAAHGREPPTVELRQTAVVGWFLILAALIATAVGCADRDMAGDEQSPVSPGTPVATEAFDATGTVATVVNSEAVESPVTADDPEGTENSPSFGIMGGAAVCFGAIRIEGVWYFHDHLNDGRLRPAALGESFGRIEHGRDCEATTPTDFDEGIWSASGPPVGTEVRAVRGRSIEELIAVITDGLVEVYRSPDVDPLAAALDGDIVAIGINSDYDGRTRFATIDDLRTVTALAEEARGAAGALNPPPDVNGGPAYTIAFEHPSGLVTAVPYAIDDGRLAARTVGDVWFDSVTRALAQSPPAPTVEGVELSGTGGSAAFHPMGACRHDRVDLEVTPGEHLRADFDDSLEVRWEMLPPENAAYIPYQIGAVVIVPNFRGTMMLEASPRHENIGLYDEVVDIPRGCTMLRSSASVGSGAATSPEPTGLLACVNIEREPTWSEYTSDETTTFDTIDVQAGVRRQNPRNPPILLPG